MFHSSMYIIFSNNYDPYNRSTPFEVLHTLLLGAYKYLLKFLMKRLHTAEKKELLAKLSVFNYSGMDTKITGNLCYHYRSFVGRDYKALAQIALYLFGPYLLPEEKAVWLALSKVKTAISNDDTHSTNTADLLDICHLLLRAFRSCKPHRMASTVPWFCR